MGNSTSIHLEDFLHCENSYENKGINTTWLLVKNIRKVATGAIEKLREDKVIRSSLEAHLDIFVDKDVFENVKDIAFDEIAITSSFKLHIINEHSPGFEIEEFANIKVNALKMNGQKCQRCWKYKDKLIKDQICKRCNDAINSISE